MENTKATTENQKADKLRKKIKKLNPDYVLNKSRTKQTHINDQGQYQIIDSCRNTVINGVNYDLSLDDVEAFIENQLKK